MGLVYLAALVAGLGAILLPSVLGGHGADADADAGEPAHDPLAPHAGHGDPLVALFASLRFWSFASLAFGLSGGLLHLFALASPGVVLALALASGGVSGLFAALAFRALRRGAIGTAAATSDAVGRVGRVIVACARGRVGQVRLELGGQLVDLAATTSEEHIPRGAEVVVVEVRPSAPVHVATAPPELGP